MTDRKRIIAENDWADPSCQSLQTELSVFHNESVVEPNKSTGVRMTECRTCYNQRTRDRHRNKRARERGWEIHKTASQIARSPDIGRTVALLENLVDVMGGPERLVEQRHAECWKLTKQKRSSTRLARMYEMLIVLMGQVRGA